nr:MAG: putative RNA-dependent RNA polymerase [Narnaviridae sp.]
MQCIFPFNLNIKVSFPQRVLRSVPSALGAERRGPVRVKGVDPGDIMLHPVRQERYFSLGRAICCSQRPKTPAGLGLGMEDPLRNGKVVLHRLTTKDRRFRLILHYLRVFPHGLPEKKYVKIIKNTLSDEFSFQMDQERPDIPDGRVALFPSPTQKRLDKRFRGDRKNRCRFYKNLLESKSLCAPVGADMILDTYVEHKQSLCRPESEVLSVPDDFLQELFRYGKSVGREISRYYKPFKTSLPNTRATVESSRRKGGARKALEGSLEIQKGPLYLSLLDQSTRPEPFVVGLFGPPGSGKTTSVVSLIGLLAAALFPSRRKEELSYSRSCSTKHWDGYKGQPIVVLDDFGQDLSDRSDLVEFEQLVSTNRYLLPMADLQNKGMAFVSPIIILTSNVSFGSPLLDASAKPIVEDHIAVWRRFHLPLRVVKDDELMTYVPPLSREPKELLVTRFHRYTLSNVISTFQEDWKLKHLGKPRFYGVGPHGYPRPSTLGPEYLLDTHGQYNGLTDVATDMVTRFREHMDFHCSELSGTWRQFITCLRISEKPSELRPFHDLFVERQDFPYESNDISISQIFSSYPPAKSPVVHAIAIPEPLKVRMITKAEAETKCLQPLQQALFRYLMGKPQFGLTHGLAFRKREDFGDQLEWIYRIEAEIQKILCKRSEGDVWLSGDYKSATDAFPMSVTNALLEGILSEIDHLPTKAWARYEVSSHQIQYPCGLGSGTQTSGQLMGSLLSFPLLCFLNDFIVRRSGAEEGKYLINGDDVVVLGSREFISNWKRDAPKVGLSLSVGKNFVDEHFCVINSQLFYDGNVQHTGKVSLGARLGKSISRCFAEMQFYYGFDAELKREFVRRNLLELRKTPRCLSVPVSHGGLGLSFLEDLTPGLIRKSIECYLHDYTKPYLKSLPIPGMDHLRALRVPVGFFSDDEMVLGGGNPIENEVLDLLSSLETDPPDDSESEYDDLSHTQLSKSIRLIKLASERRFNQTLARDLKTFPLLGSLRFRTVFVEKGKVGFLKERILALTMDLLISEIDKRPLGVLSDPEFAFCDIHREFLDELDPLFGSQFSHDFTMDEAESCYEVREFLPDELIDDLAREENDSTMRHSELLPGIEARIVTKGYLPPDLVSLLRGTPDPLPLGGDG